MNVAVTVRYLTKRYIGEYSSTTGECDIPFKSFRHNYSLVLKFDTDIHFYDEKFSPYRTKNIDQESGMSFSHENWG